MTSLNLTQVEAAERARRVGKCHYDIALDLTVGETLFDSITDVHFTVKEAGPLFIDLRADSVAEVVLDGNQLQVDFANGIDLGELAEGEHHLRITAKCIYSRTGQGLHRFVDPADNEVYMYTQFETADAKRVFACFDQPDIKATYTMTVTTPTGWKVISNPEMTVEQQGEKSIHRGEVDYLLSTYLVAFCCGPYHEVRDSWTGTLTHHPETPEDQPHELTVPFGLYCRKSLAHALDSEQLFRETKQGFDFYHANFGMAYPFKKYDQIFCPEYNMGAMENAGCVTFRDEYVFTSKNTRRMYERRCDTILHELAHMWFGDLVTMEWWGDLWLNESFATWSAAISQSEATEFDTAWVTFANVEKNWAYGQDQLPTTHPIVASAKDIETVEQNFDGITYAKGASVFKQLQAYVGREAFFKGVRQHFANHAFGNATFEDLLGALAQASGRDLSGWAQEWLTTTGVNTLKAKFTVQNGVYNTFAIEQSGAAPGAGECRTHRLAVGLYSLVDGRVVRTHRAELDIAGESTTVEEFLEVPAADLVVVNDDDLTYALVELDADSLEFVRNNIAKIEDPMARALCWSSCWQMTREGKMKAHEYVQLVIDGAFAETENFVLTSILAQADQALRTYVAEQHLPEWEQKFASALLKDLLRAEPGSDAQLSFLQRLAECTISGLEVDGVSATALFEQLLAGDTTALPGIEVDADLHWRVLTALIASGHFADDAAAQEAIDAQLQADPTASGQHAAWTAEGAIPSAAHKQQTFNTIITGAKLSNLELRHRGMGLTRRTEPALMAGLSEQFFTAAPQVWEDFESEVALRTLSELFPYWDLTPATVEHARRTIDAAQADGLKRVLSEGLDRVERALRLREVDAA